MRRSLVVVAALPAEMPRGLASLGITPVLAGPRARSLGGGALPGTGPLLVTGTCGALVPGVPVGSLVLATSVRDEGGTLAPDEGLRCALEDAARRASIPVRGARFVHADSLTDGEDERARLAARSGASCVDLESAILARAALAAGRPWAVLRVVSDAPGDSLRWLADLLGAPPEDQPATSRLLMRLLTRPGALPKLVRLGRIVGRGRSDVRRILTALPE